MVKTDGSSKWRELGLPPPKKRIVYAYRCTVKACGIFFFGLFSLLMGLVIIPLQKLFLRPASRARKASRAACSVFFRLFLGGLRLLGTLKMDLGDLAFYRNVKSTLVVANHPSLYDMMILISLFPNADCVVNKSLTKGVLAWVVRGMYTLNDMGYEALVASCRQSLADGAVIIIFPEGTRTPRQGAVPYKRGAAHIAHETGADLLPVYIGGNDKYGLGKHDPLFSYNPTEVYSYYVRPLEEVHAADYASLSSPMAARRMTERVHELLAKEALARDNRVI